MSQEPEQTPPRPGDASEEPEPEDKKVDPQTVLGRAHYAGVTDAEAREQWARETLCTGCLSAPMCKVGTQTQEPLIVVRRCLAYLPAGG